MGSAVLSCPALVCLSLPSFLPAMVNSVLKPPRGFPLEKPSNKFTEVGGREPSKLVANEGERNFHWRWVKSPEQTNSLNFWSPPRRSFLCLKKGWGEFMKRNTVEYVNLSRDSRGREPRRLVAKEGGRISTEGAWVACMYKPSHSILKPLHEAFCWKSRSESIKPNQRKADWVNPSWDSWEGNHQAAGGRRRAKNFHWCRWVKSPEQTSSLRYQIWFGELLEFLSL